jgi:hypothetical protein
MVFGLLIQISNSAAFFKKSQHFEITRWHCPEFSDSFISSVIQRNVVKSSYLNETRNKNPAHAGRHLPVFLYLYLSASHVTCDSACLTRCLHEPYSARRLNRGTFFASSENFQVQEIEVFEITDSAVLPTKSCSQGTLKSEAKEKRSRMIQLLVGVGYCRGYWRMKPSYRLKTSYLCRGGRMKPSNRSVFTSPLPDRYVLKPPYPIVFDRYS